PPFLSPRLFRQPVNLFPIGVGELRDQFRCDEVLLQRFENARLDLLAADRPVIAAGALRTPTGTAVAVLSHDRAACPAAAAHQKAREQKTPAVRAMERIALRVSCHLERGRLLGSLHILPE